MCTDGKWNILLSGQKYKEAVCTPNYINLSIFRTQSELLVLCYYFTNDDLGNFHSQNIVKSKIFVCRSCSPPPPNSLRIYEDALVALVCCGGGHQRCQHWKAPGRIVKLKASLNWKARSSSKAPSPTKPTQTLLGLLVQY